jgi:dynein heavy chain
MSLYSVFNITQPSKEQIQRIYNAILSKKLQDFPEDLQACVPLMTTATMSLFTSIFEGLPRTPLKFHYIFNMRNISSIYEGMFQATVDKIGTKGALIRLWRNECMRIFGDRLISEEDRVLVNENLIPELVEKHFKDVAEEVLVNPTLFGDYAMADPSDPDAEDPRLYEDLGTYQRVRDKMDKILEEYNFENAPMNLVLFNEALEHTTKVHRIIRLPRGCALLVGYGGSGKQSVTKLATYLADYSLFTINLARNYKEFDFRMDLQELYKSVLSKPRTFMFTDAHVAEEGFLELINNILTIGMVPALFMEEEKDGLMSPLDAEIRKKKLPDSKEYRW